MNTGHTPTETADYVHATPGRVMSTLAYTLLTHDDWPVYVNTARSYTAYYQTGEPTDPGNTIHASAHYRPVGNWHGLAAWSSPHPDGTVWPLAAAYLDDRVTAESQSGTYHGPGTHLNVEWVYDEYFIHVSSPNGVNMVEYSDYSGGTVQRSNYRSLLRDYPDVFVEISYAHGGHGLAIPLFVPVQGRHDHEASEVCQTCPHYDADKAEELARYLIGLEHYPLYDEEDHSNLEREMVEEALADDWYRKQIRDGVAEELSEFLLAAEYPLQLCAKEECFGGCGGRERAEGNGVDLYDYTEALAEWLDDCGDNLLTWDYGYYGDWKDAQNESVYTLYGNYAEEHCHVHYEESGVCFTQAEEDYRAVAEHLYKTRRKHQDLPSLPDPREFVS